MRGGAGSVTLRHGGMFTIVGEAVGNFNPAPTTGRSPVPDPFASLPAPSADGLPVRSSARFRITGTRILSPGYYRGGWEIDGTALLRPGLYYIDGGGVSVKGGGSLYSIDAAATETTDATWSSNCTPTACGVLIFNTGQDSMGGIVAAGSHRIRLRGYDPLADMLALGLSQYTGIAIWQDAFPAPAANRVQPEMVLKGDNALEIVGGLYLPSARLTLVGNQDGTFAQFDTPSALVVFDLKLQGSSDIRLRFDGNAFQQYDYGLAD
ncbi:MAG: hypothetical protein M3N29_00195 [Chloroflexota bacterium]|nr:hypothetical protein [Chloroflexota bacterium]